MKRGTIQLKNDAEKLFQHLYRGSDHQKKTRRELALKYLQTRLGYSEQRAKAALKR